DTQRARETPATLALDDYWRARAAWATKEKAVVIQAFEEALRREPTNYWWLLRLGCARCVFGQTPEDFGWATGSFSGCILKRPRHAPAYACRGYAYSKLGQSDKAVADYSKAIELDPKYATAWNDRGAVYSELNQLHKAVADLSRALELDPKYATA